MAEAVYYERTTTFILTVTIPAGAPAYGKRVMDIVVPESGLTYKEYPAERPLYIIDAYIRSDADAPVDGVLRIIKNRERVLATSVNVKSLVATNPAKPHAFGGAIPFYDRTELLQVEFLNTDAGGTSDQTVKVHLEVLLEPA
jgi:hypothetical protein